MTYENPQTSRFEWRDSRVIPTHALWKEADRITVLQGLWNVR